MKSLKLALLLTPLLLTGCPWDSKEKSLEPILLPIEHIETPVTFPSPEPSEPEASEPAASEAPAGNEGPTETPEGEDTPTRTPSPTPPQPQTPTPTPPTQGWQTDMLILVNQARATGYICGGAFHSPQLPLSIHPLLENAAQGHADDMLAFNHYGHTSVDGRTLANRVTQAGYDWRSAGENIAAGQRSVEEVMQDWLNSAGHCANIMSPNFIHVGFGHSEGESQFGNYWVQNFGSIR